MDTFGGTSRATRSLAWGVVLFLILPLTVVLPVSVTDQRYLSLPQHGVSLQHYAHLFTSEEWLASIGQSFIIACTSSFIAVSAGTFCAIACWRINSRLTNFVRIAMLAPIIVPHIVYALGLYRFYIDLNLLDTWSGAILAHAVTGIPYVVITVSTALANFDHRLEQAARSLGATVLQSLRLVILPNIAPGILSGAIFAFIHSWDELLLMLFIASRDIHTLPRRIWDGINDNLDPTMAAVAVVLMVVSTVLLIVEMRLRAQRQN